MNTIEAKLEFGSYVKELREAKGLTQRQLAALVGVIDNHVSDVENGVREISPERYEKFADVLGVPHCIFAVRILRHYCPFMHKMLFGN